MNQLAAMILSFALGTVLAATLYSTTSLNTASFYTTGAVGSPEAFSTFTMGPSLNNLSTKDDYASYQWALRNDDQVQRIECKLDIKTMDPITSAGENEVDSISLPSLGPNNFKALTTDVVEGIDINIQPAWKFCDQLGVKHPVVVVVIDTGIDTTHPDPKDPMWVNGDEIPGDDIDNDENGYIDNVNRWNLLGNTNQLYVGGEDNRGTHATGTIAMSRDGGGVVGINDGQYAKIMFLKTLDGESDKGSPESIMAAIRYTEANGARIYNLSLNSEDYTEEFMIVVQNSKILFVVAVGNGDENEKGYSIDQYPVYPISLLFDNMVTMTNPMFGGRLDRSPNYGPVNADLVASGCFILSMIPDRPYAFMTDTSTAALMVTGAAAMVYSARPDLDLIGIKDVFPTSAKKLDTLNGRILSGGVLDVCSALQWGRSQ